MKSNALIALFLFISLITNGQFLLLKNYRNFKTVRFNRGDSITYKLKEKKAEWKFGHIEIITDTTLLIQGVTVRIDKIAAIKIPRDWLHFKKDGKALIISGFFLSGVSIINDLIRHNAISFTKGQVISYSALIVTGVILLNLPAKVCNLNRKYSLRVYHEFPFPYQEPKKWIPLHYKL